MNAGVFVGVDRAIAGDTSRKWGAEFGIQVGVSF